MGHSGKTHYSRPWRSTLAPWQSERRTHSGLRWALLFLIGIGLFLLYDMGLLPEIPVDLRALPIP